MEQNEKRLYIAAPFGFGRRDAGPEERTEYLRKLARQTQTIPDRLGSCRISCIRVGGAATRLPPEPLAELLSGLRRRYGTEDMELTLTAAPVSLTSPLLSALAASGYTRIELEALSLSSRVLASVGSPHTMEDVEDALELLMDFRCPSLSVKLLYGTPGQTWGQLRDALFTCAALPAMGHIRLLPWSLFRTEQGSDGTELLQKGTAWLEERGFRIYAPGRFALPGKEERFARTAGTECLCIG